MNRMVWLLLLWLVPALLPAVDAFGQDRQGTAADWAWKPLFRYDGLKITYLFYNRANNSHNGVVIMLENTNPYPIDYRFEIVFRSEGEERVEMVRGWLKAGERVTGESAGLFWMPFGAGRDISELGLRDYHVQRHTGRAAS